LYLIDGPLFDETTKSVSTAKFGLLASSLKEYGERGQFSEIAHFYTLVGDGLILTRHIFKGVNRRMFTDGDMGADEKVLVYVQTPSVDYEWGKDRFRDDPVELPAPRGCVYTVLINPNSNHRDDYPEVAGWINRWAWVEADLFRRDEPINARSRYSEKLWSKEA
jgi:hypothetical protein